MLKKITFHKNRSSLMVVAIAGISAFSSSQATTLYDKDGLSYDLNGDFQVQLRKQVGDDKKLDLEFDDLELKNLITYQLNDKLTAFGHLDYSFDKEANNEDSDEADGGRLEEAYLGFAFHDIRARFGKQNYSTDEFSVEKAYETVVEDDIFDLNDDQGDDVVRVDATFNNVFVSLSTDLEAEGNPNSDRNRSTDFLVSTSIADFEFAAAYQSYREAGADTVDSWGVSAVYDAGFATFGADYGSRHGSGDDSATVYNLVSTFDITNTINAAIGVQDRARDDTDTHTTGWYANATYLFPEQKNVRLFAEIGDTDEDNSSIGYLAGIRLLF